MASWKWAAALVAVLGTAAVAVQGASEFNSPHVAHLTSANYDDKVSDGKVYFIKFYAPWCGHCKRLAPAWKELGASLKDNKDIVIAHVDCTTSRDVCSSADIKGYPTLKVFHKGEEYKAYRGPREMSALKTFIQDAAKDLLNESS